MTEQVEDGDVLRAHSLARQIFTDVATKWALLIVNVLRDRVLRFTELRGEIDGISHKMLTQTLRTLERDGVVIRVVHPTVPPKVEYSLTEAGLELVTMVNGMCGWTRKHLATIERSRREFDEG